MLEVKKGFPIEIEVVVASCKRAETGGTPVPKSGLWDGVCWQFAVAARNLPAVHAKIIIDAELRSDGFKWAGVRPRQGAGNGSADDGAIPEAHSETSCDELIFQLKFVRNSREWPQPFA